MSKRMSRYPTDRKVYVGDLGNNARKNELEYIFSEYGTLRSVWIARNPPGFAFVEYEDARDAADAVRGLDGRTICGRRVRVELSTGKFTNGRLERNGSSRNRGKGFHPGGKCYECGGRGHYARDCRRHGRYRRSPSRSRSRSYSRDHRTRSRTGSQSRSYSRSRSRNASVKRESRDVRHRSKSRENDRRSRSIGNGSATNEHHHTSSGAVGGSGSNGDKRSSLKHHHHHHHHHRRNVSSPKRSTHSNTPRRSSHERSKSSRSFSNSRRVRSYSRSSSHSRSHSKEKNNRD